MRVLDSGHRYSLATLDGDGTPELLQFVKREGLKYPGNVGHYPGTTMQEVLRALIERARYVNNQIACAETEAAIGCMETALLLFEMRAARRHKRHLDATAVEDVVSGATCVTCGHVGCKGHAAEPQQQEPTE